MSIESIIQQATLKQLNALWGRSKASLIQVQNTRKEVSGDITIVVFPFLHFSKKYPELTE